MMGEKGESGNVVSTTENETVSVERKKDGDPVARSDDGNAATEISVPPLSHSLIFKTLQDQRRRCVLHYLKRNDGIAPVGEMAQTIAAWEEASPETAVNSTARKRVYTSLYQVHLPNMAKNGFLTYDQKQGVVSLQPRAAELVAYLEMNRSTDISWSLFYLGLSALFATVTVLNTVIVPPLLIVSGSVWSLVFATLFLVASAVHVYRSKSTSIWQGDRPKEMQVP